MKKLTEGRKPIVRSLPRLVKAGGRFQGFCAGENRSERIYKLLSTLIRRFRQGTPRPFYSIRETMVYFKASQTTVARVYRRLDREGMLTLVRSSQTLITAHTPRPRFAIRGVVCMPIWLPGFLYFLDWRKWFSQLEEELSHYHFVLEPIFYKAGEEVKPAFVDRVLRFNPNYVLWSWPSKPGLMTIQSISDAGVPLILVQDNDEQFPGRSYHTSNERALRQGIAEWAASGKIKEIVIPAGNNPQEKGRVFLQSVLKGGSLPYRFEACPEEESSISVEDLLSYLRRLAPDRRTGVIFANDLLYVHLCMIVQEEMISLIHRRRVMVLRQAIIPSLKLAPLAGLTVDAVLYPWKKLARRIAMDLNKSKGAISSGPTLLEAEWRPQIPLEEVLQTAFNE